MNTSFLNTCLILFLFSFLIIFSYQKNNENNGGAFDILPDYKGIIKPGSEIHFQSKCFQNNSARISLNGNNAILNLTTNNPVSKTCFDMYLLSTSKSFDFTYVFLHGQHAIKLKFKNDKITQLVKNEGLMIFRISGNIIDLIKGGFQLYEVFMKNDPTTIRKMIEEREGFSFRRREHGVMTKMNWDQVQSGDLMPIMKFNNVEAYIVAGINSRSGHASMFMRNPYNKKELYVVEAQPESGIFMTPIETWFETMHNGTYDGCYSENCACAILPLSNEARKHFDEVKVWNFLQNELIGQPYLTSGEFFAAIDSANPEGYKKPLSIQFLFTMAIIADKYQKFKSSVKGYILDGLNMRLGTDFNSIQEIYNYCDLKKINIFDVFAMPELNTYRYKTKEGKYVRALQCSSTVALLYKVSGLFDYYLGESAENLIQEGEFTPRDLYQLAFFNTTKNPYPGCSGYDDLKYCQPLGNWLMDLEGINSIRPYPHMNEKCQMWSHSPPFC